MPPSPICCKELVGADDRAGLLGDRWLIDRQSGRRVSSGNRSPPRSPATGPRPRPAMPSRRRTPDPGTRTCPQVLATASWKIGSSVMIHPRGGALGLHPSMRDSGEAAPRFSEMAKTQSGSEPKPSSRRSHARVKPRVGPRRLRRCPRTTAACSPVSPAKNRSSTSLALTGSCSFSRAAPRRAPPGRRSGSGATARRRRDLYAADRRRFFRPACGGRHR